MIDSLKFYLNFELYGYIDCLLVICDKVVLNLALLKQLGVLYTEQADRKYLGILNTAFLLNFIILRKNIVEMIQKHLFLPQYLNSFHLTSAILR